MGIAIIEEHCVADVSVIMSLELRHHCTLISLLFFKAVFVTGSQIFLYSQLLNVCLLTP